MDILENLYETAIKKSTFVERKQSIQSPKTQIITNNGFGATELIFSVLTRLKASSYLYIDLNDWRIEKELLFEQLSAFCREKEIHTLAIENFDPLYPLPDVAQIIITTPVVLNLEHFESLKLFPLDFEEFLALDNRYDTLESALSHFLQIGGFPSLVSLPAHTRQRYLQDKLRLHLNDIELEVLGFVARQLGDKISVYHMFERLKLKRKLSKDLFYKTFYRLIEQRWILPLEKYGHAKAAKKLYLVDFAIKPALTFHKNFSKLFETMVFLELKKIGKALYYDEHIDFYLPNESRVVLTHAFANDKTLFTLLERIEGWLIAHDIKKLEVVTMNHEGILHHPFITVELIPFTRWALMES